MKALILTSAFFFCSVSFAQDSVSCSVFSLGFGANNYTAQNALINLNQSPSKTSLVGETELRISNEVPEEGRAATFGEHDNKLNLKFEYQNGNSKWSREKGELRLVMTLRSQNDELLAFHEASSNIIKNPSDMRIADSKNKLALSTKLRSMPQANLVLSMSEKLIDVLGVELTIGELIQEMGWSGAVEHLAAQGLVEPSGLAEVQVDCAMEETKLN
jgi:hypothetical protein